jgi:tetratricopeptide (TPR) repeat protein
VKARLINMRRLAASLVLVAGSAGALAAQARQMPVARIMVPVFRSADKATGVQAANAIRSRLEGDVSPRALTVIPKDQIDTTLKASGYPVDEALNSNDAKALATLLRADEYVEGVVARTPEGAYRVDARLVLARDNNVSQPLPLAEGAKLGDVAAALSRSIRDARRQVDDEKECYINFRLSKYDDAIRRARAAIAKYDRATMARICLMQAYEGKKAPADSVLLIAEEILRIDSLSRPALASASGLYLAKGDTTSYVRTLLRMLAADPTNPSLVEKIVRDLGAIGRSREAIPAIETALAANPGDPSLTRIAWLIYLASNEFKKALATGEELTKVDTTAFDSTFATRMAGAALSDSQPQKALEWLARGTQRFPDNATLWLLRGQQESRLGQNQQAVESIRRALAANPAVENGYLILAQTFSKMEMPDSILGPILQAARAPNANVAMIAAFALSQGNQLYRRAAESKQRADYQKAIPLLTLADSLGAGPNAKFLLGVTAFQIGVAAAQEAAPAKSCELAREAQANFAVAQVNVPAGGRENPEAAGQIMQALGQFSPVVDNQVKQFCRTR